MYDRPVINPQTFIYLFIYLFLVLLCTTINHEA